jgi:hypothetical protein
MDRTEIESSNVKSVGYDPEAEVMEVEFHSGGVYQYHGVEPSVHDGLLNAVSPGAYLHQHVKGRCDCTRQ